MLRVVITSTAGTSAMSRVASATLSRSSPVSSKVKDVSLTAFLC